VEALYAPGINRREGAGDQLVFESHEHVIAIEKRDGVVNCFGLGRHQRIVDELRHDMAQRLCGHVGVAGVPGIARELRPLRVRGGGGEDDRQRKKAISHSRRVCDIAISTLPVFADALSSIEEAPAQRPASSLSE